MKKHELELSDFQDWLSDKETVYARCTHPRKQIAVTMNGTIKVYYNGEVIWSGVQPFNAIEEYNAI